MMKKRILWIVNYLLIFIAIFCLVITINKGKSSMTLEFIAMVLFLIFQALLQKSDDLEEWLQKRLLK